MLTARLAALGRPLPRIVGVIITHGHSDHAAHACTYGARWRCPIFTTAATLRSLRLRPSVEARTFKIGKRLAIGDIDVHSRPLPHDAPQIALAFETSATTIGLATDLGHVPKGLSGFLSGCETILLESNHDPEMLRVGPYPPSVKRRVSSAVGHLSNEQASDLLADLRHSPACVVLMHLSATNNSARLARSSAEAALGHRGTELLVAPRRRALELPFGGSHQLQLGL
jgi:phosphoribosyl 1,2-cyclic phosphodiesterase